MSTGGDAIAEFATAGLLASYAGLVPVPRDSGPISGNLHRPKRCSNIAWMGPRQAGEVVAAWIRNT